MLPNQTLEATEVVLPDMSEVMMHLEDAVEADDLAQNEADSVEIAKEALVLPKTEADDSKEEIANEADDSLEIASRGRFRGWCYPKTWIRGRRGCT